MSKLRSSSCKGHLPVCTVLLALLGVGCITTQPCPDCALDLHCNGLESAFLEAWSECTVLPFFSFLYTPLLPAVATGTIEERSIVEPVRRILGDKVAALPPFTKS